jgi:hypothetical protein
MSAAPAAMSAVPTVTMQDLELEYAELLPGRETLCCCELHPRYTEGPMTPWRA